MPITEQQLREHLTAAARHAGPPGFTVENVAARIRHRRTLRATAACACAAVVVALAVALPVALTGGTTSAPQGSLGGAAGAPLLLRNPRFTATVNGRRPSWLRNPPSGDPEAGCGSVARPCPGRIPGFTVTPGERLTFTVTVTFPARARITALWIGFAPTIAPTRTGPIGMSPVLVHTQGVVSPRTHTYRFTWTVPTQLHPGTRQQLVAAWTGSLPVLGPPGIRGRLVSGEGGTAVTTLAVIR
jgi:hypothetical protein